MITIIIHYPKPHLSINAANEEIMLSPPGRSTRPIRHIPTLKTMITEGALRHFAAEIVPRRAGGFGQTLRMRPPPIEKRSQCNQRRPPKANTWYASCAPGLGC